MALIVYNKENSRPQQVVYQGKRTITRRTHVRSRWFIRGSGQSTWTARERFTCQRQCLSNWGFSVEDGLISHTMKIRENGISAIRQTRTVSRYGKIKGVPDSLPDSSCEESCFRLKWKGRPYSL